MRLRTPLRAATGGIFFIGLALAIALGNQLGGDWFIAIFFITLACTSFIGSLNFNRRGVYSGSYGFIWLLAIALFFITSSWLWFLVAIGVSAILGSLWRPMMRGSFSPQQPYYQQPPYQPTNEQPPSYQSYEQGYQPPAQQPPAAYQEGAQQYPYPQAQEPQYEQPQVQYPQEMPPPQQG